MISGIVNNKLVTYKISKSEVNKSEWAVVAEIQDAVHNGTGYEFSFETQSQVIFSGTISEVHDFVSLCEKNLIDPNSLLQF